jgi:N-acetylglucosamine kinase-like BadF-type ATPase
MNQHLYVIGIDSGGTKTTAILCALDNAILAEAQGGPSNFQIIGVEQSAATILDLIETCCHSVGCKVSQIGAIVAGLAGAGRPGDQQQMTDGLLASAEKRNLTLNKIRIESDARIALEGAFGGKPGIILIAGTGSIVFGKDDRGKTHRAGGWGRIIGDDGSGYAIGQEAFRAVARYLDDLGGKTKLGKFLDAKYGFKTQEDIINALYKRNFDVASIAPTVIEAASGGDRIARRILIDGCSGLTELARVVCSKMNKGKNFNKPQLVMTGSLLLNQNIYSRMVRLSIKRNLPHVSIREPESSPVVGAALMAIKLMKL